MNRLGRAAVMFCLGTITLRLVFTGGFGWFVQQHMRIPLLAAAGVLVTFGGYETFVATREERRSAASAGRSAGPTVGWLLLLPLLVLISVAPTGLGAAAADRVDAYRPTPTRSAFGEIDLSGGVAEMRVLDFVTRALWDDSRSLDGVPVRLEGLVVNDAEIVGGFQLTRFVVSCCAADGLPVQVVVHHDGPPLDDDTWVVAEVRWRPPPDDGTGAGDAADDRVVRADAMSITVVPDAPRDAYESPY